MKIVRDKKIKKTYYDEISPSYENLYSKEQLKKYELIKPFFSTLIDFDFFDVGCGLGLFLDYLFDFYDMSKIKINELTLIDSSFSLLKIARSRFCENEKLKNVLKNIHLFCYDAFYLFELLKKNMVESKEKKILIVSFTAIQNFDDPFRFINKTTEISNFNKNVMFFYSFLKKSKFATDFNNNIKNTFLNDKMTFFEDDRDFYITNIN